MARREMGNGEKKSGLTAEALQEFLGTLVVLIRQLSGGLPVVVDAPESGWENLPFEHALGAWVFRTAIPLSEWNRGAPIQIVLGLIFRDNGQHCAADYLKYMTDGLEGFEGLSLSVGLKHAGHHKESGRCCYVLQFSLTTPQDTAEDAAPQVASSTDSSSSAPPSET